MEGTSFVQKGVYFNWRRGCTSTGGGVYVISRRGCTSTGGGRSQGGGALQLEDGILEGRDFNWMMVISEGVSSNWKRGTCNLEEGYTSTRGGGYFSWDGYI